MPKPASLPRCVAIYARISHDAGGASAGVSRQVTDCHKLAAALGWGVGGEYVDNDLSAYTGKRRPEYERMLTDLSDGVVDGVLVYNSDRLTRRPAELEHFYDVVRSAGVEHNVRFVTGDLDLGTDEGLMQLRILGAFAAKESANISRRVARKHEQNAAEGKPHRGSVRPFGYEADFVTVREDEADLIRGLVARFLAGESLRSLATWLIDQEVPTVTGSQWTTSTMKGILTSSRIAGLRMHRGEVVAQGQWEPIISEDEYRRIQAQFAERRTSGRRTPQRYLLTGLLRCGKCDTRLYSSARATTRRYVCASGPNHGGCGKLTITADPLERLIADAVLYRLDTPELADVLAGRSSADERTQELTRALDAAQQSMDDLALAHGNGQITLRDWMIAKRPIEARLEVTKRRLEQVTHTGSLAGMVGNGEELRRSWSSLNLSRQHAIVRALVDHAVIGPGRPGAQSLDPARVDVRWRY